MLDWAASMEAYQKLEKIGEGTYGVVYKAKHRDTGTITRWSAPTPFGLEAEANGVAVTFSLDETAVTFGDTTYEPLEGLTPTFVRVRWVDTETPPPGERWPVPLDAVDAEGFLSFDDLEGVAGLEEIGARFIASGSTPLGPADGRDLWARFGERTELPDLVVTGTEESDPSIDGRTTWHRTQRLGNRVITGVTSANPVTIGLRRFVPVPGMVTSHFVEMDATNGAVVRSRSDALYPIDAWVFPEIEVFVVGEGLVLQQIRGTRNAALPGLRLYAFSGGRPTQVDPLALEGAGCRGRFVRPGESAADDELWFHASCSGPHRAQIGIDTLGFETSPSRTLVRVSVE